MTEQEKTNLDVDKRLSNLETKFELFMEEARQQREDIRRLHERQDVQQAKTDARLAALDEKIQANQKEFTAQLHSNFVQTMIGVGAIMAAIGGLIIAALK